MIAVVDSSGSNMNCSMRVMPNRGGVADSVVAVVVVALEEFAAFGGCRVYFQIEYQSDSLFLKRTRWPGLRPVAGNIPP